MLRHASPKHTVKKPGLGTVASFAGKKEIAGMGFCKALSCDGRDTGISSSRRSEGKLD